MSPSLFQAYLLARTNDPQTSKDAASLLLKPCGVLVANKPSNIIITKATLKNIGLMSNLLAENAT